MRVAQFSQRLPPVDNEVPETSSGPLGRIITVLKSSLLPAALIDHDAPRPAEPQPGVTVEYGRYMDFICSLCHGDALSGGSVPSDESDASPAPNLTPGGRSLDSENMLWKFFTKMTDDELKAIWLYLQSLPAKEFKEK